MILLLRRIFGKVVSIFVLERGTILIASLRKRRNGSFTFILWMYFWIEIRKVLRVLTFDPSQNYGYIEGDFGSRVLSKHSPAALGKEIGSISLEFVEFVREKEIVKRVTF